MIGTLIRFKYGDDFDEKRVREVAHGARGMFENMPGLRSKAFTVDAAGREAFNFYVWDSDEAARGFFSPDVVKRVTELYGVPPTLQYSSVIELV